mmetsp:Transcript_6421/g.8681  ORF Transcript_6421/g.8681 Transcript_6421/m.8681 type:complete len:81 (-) Transcript_6421:602-844(-)
MEKYRLVGERKAETTAAASGGEASVVEDEPVEGSSSPSSSYEVRITQQGKPRNYISYAMNLFVSNFLIRWQTNQLYTQSQ